MATIKALGGPTVHQIQSGQVIVDLCSVVKELVENSLDAGATSIDVRFKGYGLDAVEVQDNGDGITQDNFDSLGLKHYTSKLSSYDDLSKLTTFGFRGEALSSLCALSYLHITTAQEHEAPKGTRLNFDLSGRLKSTSVVACQKGTTVSVETLFHNLPVRRRELEKNIKREYGKVLNVLQAYACVTTSARLSVSNVLPKGKKVVAFSTRSESSVGQNIASVFGGKTYSNLLALDLSLELSPTSTALKAPVRSDTRVQVSGHVSRPIWGEGRSSTDRQMFFVNSRPCNLPQAAKVFNEVYKAFNMSQSPFVLANFQLDTEAYDVNVSPDKRTILLHDQTTLLESLRQALHSLFEAQDHTVPQSRHPSSAVPAFKPLPVPLFAKSDISSDDTNAQNPTAPKSSEPLDSPAAVSDAVTDGSLNLIGKFAARNTVERSRSPQMTVGTGMHTLSKEKKRLVKRLEQKNRMPDEPDTSDDAIDEKDLIQCRKEQSQAIQEFDTQFLESAGNYGAAERSGPSGSTEPGISRQSSSTIASNTETSVVQNAFDRMRPRRASPTVATVTIGSKTTETILGPTVLSQRRKQPHAGSEKTSVPPSDTNRQQFTSSIQAFAADGSDRRKNTNAAQHNVASTLKVHQNPIADHGSLSDDGTEDSNSEVESEEDFVATDDDGAATSRSDISDTKDDLAKATERAKVDRLISQAEEDALSHPEAVQVRAHNILKGGHQKDSTLNLVQKIDASIARIEDQLLSYQAALLAASAHHPPENDESSGNQDKAGDASTPDGVTLTVTKSDFSNMHIVGQFNLGFILASRNNADLFIIDQHASDEKVNFERLQSTTIMQNQRLVHPLRLELTAVDEEIILENEDALVRNGFVTEVDQSGDYPVGERTRLLSLPMSKEVTFRPADLEELVAMMAETPSNAGSSSIPRPSKIRKLFAMRACRSSIMIGKVMTRGMMRGLLDKMGRIDKPWNCPHGRPTMRHLCGLDQMMRNDDEDERIDWRHYLEGMSAVSEDEDPGE